MAETVARFDGFVAKYMGDGVLVYFGYPQAHEDDAEQRLFAPNNIVARADEVIREIIEIYDLPNADFRNPADRPAPQRVDILRTFGEACREDLQHWTRLARHEK